VLRLFQSRSINDTNGCSYALADIITHCATHSSANCVTHNSAHSSAHSMAHNGSDEHTEQYTEQHTEQHTDEQRTHGIGGHYQAHETANNQTHYSRPNHPCAHALSDTACGGVQGGIKKKYHGHVRCST
jgi:hypothetical protein